MQKADLIPQLLKLHDDWSISSFEIDTYSNRADITLDHKTQSKTFFHSIKKIDSKDTIVLRHLPLADMRTYLHFFKPKIETYGQDWQALHDSTITKAMELFVIEALQLCHSIHAVTKLTHLSTTVIKNISNATNIIPKSVHTFTAKTYDAHSPAIDVKTTSIDDAHDQSFELIHSNKLPPETDHVWTQLLDGDIPLNPDSVALQMLLQNIRNRNKLHPTEINRLAGNKLLRTYMVKNQKKHQQEIAILLGSAVEKNVHSPAIDIKTTSIDDAHDRSFKLIHSNKLPPETDYAWTKLLDGDIPLNPDSVALQMLLQNIRNRNKLHPTDINRLAGIKLLRTYMVKNQKKHQKEITMLLNSAVEKDARSPAIDFKTTSIDDSHDQSFELTHSNKLPPETDHSWAKLLDGVIPLNPDSVALQMLLQNIRNRNKLHPTEINRLAGIKLLRTYMVKNQKKHQQEIAMLLDVATKQPVKSTPNPIVTEAKLAIQQVIADKKDIPSINHPCWAEIINRNMQINTNKVGLQMMIQHIFSPIDDSINTAKNVRLLYEFFWKHQKHLKKEIAQIHSLINAKKLYSAPEEPEESEESLVLPSISASIWDKIITGEVTIHTKSVSMQMMMQNIARRVQHDDSETSKIVATKILQKFFVKNQKRLQEEIRQLVNAPTANEASKKQPNRPATNETSDKQPNQSITNETSDKQPNEPITNETGDKQPNEPITNETGDKQPIVYTVPPDTHPSWQKLINGELEIKTDIVALKMMLQRIRISIDKNPSDNSRIAGVKILRRYFLKHKSKHQAEITQLLVA